MAEFLSFRQREPQPMLRSNKGLMRARTAALRPSPPRIYQERISLPMEKLGGGKHYWSGGYVLLRSVPPSAGLKDRQLRCLKRERSF